MKLKIGIITSHSSLEKIKEVVPLLKDKCEITFIPCDKASEIMDTYYRHSPFYNGILFSGPLGIQEIMKKENFHPQVPLYYLDLPKDEFYKTLFELSNSNKSLNFSRVLIDFISESNNYHGLHDVLKDDEFPHIYENKLFEDQFEEIFQYHLSLWQKGLIDLSITRTGSIIDRLTAHNIPTIFMFPSKAAILEQIEGMISKLQISILLKNQPAFGMITIDKPDNQSDLDLKLIHLHKALLEFNKENLHLMIQKNNMDFEAIISSGDLKKITQNSTCCLLQQHLQKTLSFKVNIGWGIGTNLYKAKLNAQNANREAALHFPGNSFIIAADDKVNGPLGEKSCFSYSNTTDSRLEQISSTLGISTLQIQKILSMVSTLNTNELSAEDLAYHSGVTIRSANRLLNRLEEKGVAEVSYKKQEKLRGRPKKIYKVDFGNMEMIE